MVERHGMAWRGSELPNTVVPSAGQLPLRPNKLSMHSRMEQHATDNAK